MATVRTTPAAAGGLGFPSLCKEGSFGLRVSLQKPVRSEWRFRVALCQYEQCNLAKSLDFSVHTQGILLCPLEAAEMLPALSRL